MSDFISTIKDYISDRRLLYPPQRPTLDDFLFSIFFFDFLFYPPFISRRLSFLVAPYRSVQGHLIPGIGNYLQTTLDTDKSDCVSFFSTFEFVHPQIFNVNSIVNPYRLLRSFLYVYDQSLFQTINIIQFFVKIHII